MDSVPEPLAECTCCDWIGSWDDCGWDESWDGDAVWRVCPKCDCRVEDYTP